MTRIYAHRGASAYAPENTMVAFERAIEMGAQGIELDVHLSLDGALMVIHDPDVKRTTNGKGNIIDLTSTQLRELDASHTFADCKGAKIPTLQEVYELIKPTNLLVNVEIKTDGVAYAGIEQKLLSLEKSMGMRNRVLYSSFNHYTLRNLHKMDPHTFLGVLYNNALDDPWGYAQHIGAKALHPEYKIILNTPGYVACAHAAGLAVNTWTVDTSAEIRQLMDLGVDIVMTNKPNIGIETRKQYELSH